MSPWNCLFRTFYAKVQKGAVTIFKMVTKADLVRIVLGVVRQIPGCEDVTNVSLEKLPFAPSGNPNWDITRIEPLPSDDAAIAACRAAAVLKQRYFMSH